MSDSSAGDKTADDSSFIAPSQPMLCRGHFTATSLVERTTTVDEKFGESTMDLLNMETQKFDETEEFVDLGSKKEKDKNIMLMETQNVTDSDIDSTTVAPTNDVMGMETQLFDNPEAKTSAPTDDVMTMETQKVAPTSDHSKVDPLKEEDLMAMETQGFTDLPQKESSEMKEVEKSKNVVEDKSGSDAKDLKPLEDDVEMTKLPAEVEEDLIVPVQRYKCGNEEDDYEETIDMEAPTPVDKTEKEEKKEGEIETGEKKEVEVEAEVESAVEKEEGNIFEAKTQNLSDLADHSDVVEPEEKTEAPETGDLLVLAVHTDVIQPEDKNEGEPDELRILDKEEDKDDKEDVLSNASEDLLADVAGDTFGEEEGQVEPDVEAPQALKDQEEIESVEKESEEEEYEEQYLGATQLFDNSEMVVEQDEEEKLIEPVRIVPTLFSN
jgi:hypothetical protein